MRPKHLLLLAAPQTVGGQAVIEGVMMRAKDRLAIAVRRPSGEIVTEIRPWFTFGPWGFLKKPFLRGFPILMETMVNGIKALNFSATQALDEEKDGELSRMHLALTMVVAIGAALALFVVVPHLFSVGMRWLGLSGGLDSLSFHVWDGAFKMAVFVGYIGAISLVPDIRRVFQYHGAEHKVIWSYEDGRELTPKASRGYSRLHPRCGTTFLLFVLAVSILLYAVIVPLILSWYTPQSSVLKHTFIVTVKLVLMIPISTLAYEMIKFAGKFHKNMLCRLMNAPGLAMQMLTTKEPDDAQLEVAIAALKGALKGGAA